MITNIETLSIDTINLINYGINIDLTILSGVVLNKLIVD